MATLRQKAAIENVVENGGNVSKAMIDAGYSEKTAKTPQKLTESKAWMEVMNNALPDEKLAQWHRELGEQKRIDYFVFPKQMEDEEIIEHVRSVGIEVINVRESDRGKFAFYAISDVVAKKAAVEMGYKLKGHFAPEKSQSLNVTVDASKNKQVVTYLAEKLNEQVRNSLRSGGRSSDGGVANIMGDQEQAKD